MSANSLPSLFIVRTLSTPTSSTSPYKYCTTNNFRHYGSVCNTANSCALSKMNMSSPSWRFWLDDVSALTTLPDYLAF